MACDAQTTDAICTALLRFFTQAEIEAAYQQALQEYINRGTTVVITSASFEAGNASGQIIGDPADLMAAAECALQKLGVDPANVVDPTPASRGAIHNDYRCRRITP